MEQQREQCVPIQCKRCGAVTPCYPSHALHHILTHQGFDIDASGVFPGHCYNELWNSTRPYKIIEQGPGLYHLAADIEGRLVPINMVAYTGVGGRTLTSEELKQVGVYEKHLRRNDKP